MAHGATHDAAQHITPALVRRQHAVGDQEARRAQVVRDDAMACEVLAVGGHPDDVDRGGDQRAEQVDVVDVLDALQDPRDALQPHAGVDRRPRQVDALAARQLLVLHEDEVPELEEPVAILVRTARRAAGDVLALIDEDLRARPARPGVAHLPEIGAGRDADDPLVREAGDLLPQVESVIVIDVDGHEELVLVQPELLGDQLPGELDRLFLEIVAEGEVAEHLEEGVMPGGIADIVEIVVLAAGAHALLRGRRTRKRRLRSTGEIVLELDHAGVGEHQRRVVARHERARRHQRMAVLLEIAQKMGTDIVDAVHDRSGLGKGSLHRRNRGVLPPRRRPCPSIVTAA